MSEKSVIFAAESRLEKYAFCRKSRLEKYTFCRKSRLEKYMQYALLFRHFLLLEVQIVQYCRFSVIGSRFFGRDGNAVSTSGQFADHELHESFFFASSSYLIAVAA